MWARSRFATAGLTLPDIAVHRHGTLEPCRGNSGLFLGSSSGGEIHICVRRGKPEVVLHRTLLHELSHAWIQQHLSDEDRTAFLTLRGLTHWRDPARWFQRGTEHAAEIMAWGLLDIDIGVHTVEPNDPASLRDAFRFLTGVDPVCVRHRPTPSITESNAIPRDVYRGFQAR